MGQILQLSCSCGGQMKTPFGPKMPPPKVCFFPFYCRACKGMSSLDVDAEILICQHCGSRDVIPYGSPETVGSIGERIVLQVGPRERLAEVLNITDGTYWCPACESFGLSLRSCGHWD